jgi:hypothetical protein
MSIYRSHFLLATLFCAAMPASAETFRKSDVQVVGPIAYGQPTSPVRYTGRPKYRAFEFHASPGDTVEATVSAKRGRMQAYLTDSSFQSLAGGPNHFTATIPADSQPSTYYIVIAEVSARAASFTVLLERKSSVPDFLSCNRDADCVAVDRAGCCHNGWKDAVNKDKVGDYLEANACKERGVMCPTYRVNDTRVAVCDTEKHQCAMVKPKD